MTKRLYAEGVGGGIAIVNGPDDAYLTSPKTNIEQVHFHSSFSYMKVPLVYDITITFPERAANTQSESSKGKTYTWYVPTYGNNILHSVGTHSLTYKPAGLFFDSTQGLAGNYPLQQNGLSLRLVSLGVTVSDVYIVENYVTYANTLPAISKTYKVLIFKDPE